MHFQTIADFVIPGEDGVHAFGGKQSGVRAFGFADPGHAEAGLVVVAFDPDFLAWRKHAPDLFEPGAARRDLIGARPLRRDATLVADDLDRAPHAPPEPPLLHVF